jgi:O-antigen/teichoic acid export membrane protein
MFVSRLSSVIAVPLVLHSLGSSLYTVWVMGGALVMVQGLFDFGIGAALVRFVAVAAARSSRPVVLTIFFRALIFYLFLSVAVGVPLWIWAREVASLVPSLRPAMENEAALLLRYVAVAFALTNVTLVLASLLQGINRVDAAYRGQTLGWLLYVPLLAIGLRLGGASTAVGLAWVCSYGLQVLLLTVSARSAVAGLSKHLAPTPGWREMLSLGGWWQLSSWADFSTFQLPRLAGAFALSASGLFALDVALRAAQLVVAPLFAAYPLVLPIAAKAWTLRGGEALSAFLERWFLGGATGLWLFAIAFVPLERPVLAAWTGRPAESFNILLNTSVLVGVAAHASTGLFSSAQLAVGDISPVLRYKTRQLIIGLLLVPPALLWGPVPTGLALGIALAAPAVVFNWQEARAFRLRLPSTQSPIWRRLAVATAVTLMILFFTVWWLERVVADWAIVSVLLPLWGATCVLAWFWCWHGRSRRGTKEAAPSTAEADRVA